MYIHLCRMKNKARTERIFPGDGVGVKGYREIPTDICRERGWFEVCFWYLITKLKELFVYYENISLLLDSFVKEGSKICDIEKMEQFALQENV